MPSSQRRRYILREPRLAAYQQLLLRIKSGGKIWTDFLTRLPLTLGESTIDRQVPYSFSDDVLKAFEDAVDSLVDLIKRRRDQEYERDKQRALLPNEEQRVVLRPNRFCPRTLSPEGPLRTIVKTALNHSAELDGGLLESWLGQPCGGNDLYQRIERLESKAFQSSVAQPAFSGLGLLVHLAILNGLLVAKERIKTHSVRNMAYSRLERNVGIGLYAVFFHSFTTASAALGQPPMHSVEYGDSLVMQASLAPSQFISIQEDNGSLNPYGVCQEVDNLLDPFYQAGLESTNHPQQLLEKMMASITQDKNAYHALLSRATATEFRKALLDYLISFEDPGQQSDQLLAKVCSDEQSIIEVLHDKEVLGQIKKGLQARLLETNWRKADELEKLIQTINRHQSKTNAAEKQAAALQGLIERFLLKNMDEFAQTHLRKTRNRLIDRRQTHSIGQLKQEYEVGRLYRIADDQSPLIQVRVMLQEAQLFVDLKGYTRRTALAKELVMAEFLKTEFYEPILKAAKKYHTSTLLVGRHKSIELVNLLGDAVAFSGDIVSLVNLAQDIQEIFRNYRKKLEDFMGPGESAKHSTSLEKIEHRRQALRAELAQLKAHKRQLLQEVDTRSNLDLDHKVRQLQLDYEATFDRIKQHFLSLQAQLASCTDQRSKHQLEAHIENGKKAFETLTNQRKQTLAQLKTLDQKELSTRLTKELCHRLNEHIRQVEIRRQTLLEEDRSLDAALQEEQHRRGAGLESGLFISYGAASEVINLDDDIWGLQRVAISERINESARGTARNMVVKQHLDQLLACAKAKSSRATLELPFRVYILSTASFQFNPGMSRLWQHAMLARDTQALEHFMNEFCRIARERFRAGVLEGASLQSNDIYNLGEAISAATLNAYLLQNRNSHLFFRVQIRPTELHEQFVQRFLFIEDMLSLVIGQNQTTSDVEIFRYVGQVLFRGFEETRPTSVYEILRPKSEFFDLLCKHHMQDWLSEASQHPDCRVENLGLGENEHNRGL